MEKEFLHSLVSDWSKQDSRYSAWGELLSPTVNEDLGGVDRAADFAEPPRRTHTRAFPDNVSITERRSDFSSNDMWKILSKLLRSVYKMDDVFGDRSMGSPMTVAPSDLRNPGSVPTFMDHVARKKKDCRSENKELRVTAPLKDSFLGPLIKMGFSKIEDIAPTYIVLREDKSRAEEDYSRQRTTRTRATDSPKVASDVTAHMQRKNTASSSKPCNLHIFYEAPEGATICAGVQTPLQIACELGKDEFPHSSRAFPSCPPDNEAAGFQDCSAGPEIPERGVQIKTRPHLANESDGRPSKRTRCRNFSDEEKGLLLQAKLEFLVDPANKGKRHEWYTFVSDRMKEKGYNRDLEAVRTQWDTSKRRFDALRECCPQDTSYGDLTMDQKREISLSTSRDFPITFKPEWVVAMETIEKLKSTSAVKKETRGDGQEDVLSQSFVSTFTASATFTGADYLEEPGDESDSESEARDVHTDKKFSNGESGTSAESHSEFTSAGSRDRGTEPSQKRSAASAFDEDNLREKIRPFVNQQIKEALLPWINALRSREEDEHNHRQKMLALEREKLALMRQKLECTRRSNAVPANVAK